jgi:DNA-directed RNA polymerase subunit RPC12/RpoP
VGVTSDGTGIGTLVIVSSEAAQKSGFEVECPHCHKTFTAEVIEGAAARYRGFKCPHCRLFVPAARGGDDALSRDPDA